MSAPPKILIIRLSSLGDILHALPALAGLRASFPDARIDWLVASQFGFLLSSVRGIDSLHRLDTNSLKRRPGSPAAWRRLWRTVRSLRTVHYDFSIDFQGLLKTAVLGSASGSKTRLGFSKGLVREPPAHWFYHQTLAQSRGHVHVLALNQQLAELAGGRPTPVSCEFLVSEKDRSAVDSLLKQHKLGEFVVLNPGGGWPTKRWSPARYGALAEKIHRELGLQVVVTTGPGEEAMHRMIIENCGTCSPVHFPVSFLQLIPLLERALLFVGGDTGPFHLACAVGTPVAGIFGPTSPSRNGPWRDGEEAVAHMLPCSFCYGRTCPTNNECMDIPVDEVFAAADRRLGKKGDSRFAYS